MPKLIDYPRTNYTGAWELAEVVDDTGGKCAIETAARKLNRKVSGSFKAIIGSAVKFGLMTSKRELLSTTTLFKRIKHAYDKQEELQFHREAFLTPPLFTQICRKFRGRELPIQMLDVMLIREFGVEEINAQSVAKAFVEGCRMCTLLDDHNIMADIDAMTTQRLPRRELASPTPPPNNFIQKPNQSFTTQPVPHLGGQTNQNNLYDILNSTTEHNQTDKEELNQSSEGDQPAHENYEQETDAIANLFGLGLETTQVQQPASSARPTDQSEQNLSTPEPVDRFRQVTPIVSTPEKVSVPQATHTIYQMSITGPGVNTSLEMTHEEDITIAIALLEKIRRQLRAEQQHQ